MLVELTPTGRELIGPLFTQQQPILPHHGGERDELRQLGGFINGASSQRMGSTNRGLKQASRGTNSSPIVRYRTLEMEDSDDQVHPSPALAVS